MLIGPTLSISFYLFIPKNNFGDFKNGIKIFRFIFKISVIFYFSKMINSLKCFSNKITVTISIYMRHSLSTSDPPLPKIGLIFERSTQAQMKGMNLQFLMPMGIFSEYILQIQYGRLNHVTDLFFYTTSFIKVAALYQYLS